MKKALCFLIIFIMLAITSCGEATVDMTTEADTTVATETTSTEATESTTEATTEATTESTTEAEPTLAEILSDGETEATSVFTASNGGVDITVTVHGYSNKDKGYDFYVKSNDYFNVDVKVENNSGIDIYRRNGIESHGENASQLDELMIRINNGDGHALTLSSHGGARPARLYLWSIPDGNNYIWSLRVAAGEYTDYDERPYDLEIDYFDIGDGMGIYLYGEEIYTDGICTFSGTITFRYSDTDNGYYTINDKALTADVTIPVVYVK